MRIPPQPTLELLFGYSIFSGISGLVARAGRHNSPDAVNISHGMTLLLASA